MNSDFEESLRRQSIRPVPAQWRGEILRAARAQPAASPWWREWLWPHPQAWGALAAAWGIIILLHVAAPMPGAVVSVVVAVGEQVAVGQKLLTLEAMKMETTLYAESPAIVAKICVVAGQMVDHGARLIELSPVATPARPPESPPQDD